jgi:hypothetical protein
LEGHFWQKGIKKKNIFKCIKSSWRLELAILS